MNEWQTILLAFGGQVTLVAILGFLARSIIQHLLTKDVESFKQQLEAESAHAAEHLKHELSMASIEHQVRFSKLHEQRAEVITKMYQNMIEAYIAVESFVSPIEWSGTEPKGTKYVKAMNKLSDFYQHFETNRIFIPEDLCNKMVTFVDGMRSETIGLGVYYITEKDPVVNAEMRSAWSKAFLYFREVVPKARKVLEEELRSLIDPTNNR